MWLKPSQHMDHSATHCPVQQRSPPTLILYAYYIPKYTIQVYPAYN
jgi:hypothetical protein